MGTTQQEELEVYAAMTGTAVKGMNNDLFTKVVTLVVISNVLIIALVVVLNFTINFSFMDKIGSKPEIKIVEKKVEVVKQVRVEVEVCPVNNICIDKSKLKINKVVKRGRQTWTYASINLYDGYYYVTYIK